ncbi:MAG: NAD-dependent epimerase/dehydratase family protein [Candidatus Nanoarchaeia archaeon]|nr:NAD-dependent epimerase/dehydratase family protein [Candidatus Nanoarchaeia archaeon]
MKTVLVTGSAGLLGSAVVRAYEKENIKVIKHTRKDCNLLSKEETKSYISLMRDNGVDTVIHCAADVGGVLKNTLYTQYMFSNNLLINNNIIDACHLSSIPNFVNILSTCIFPQEATYPLTVDQIREGLPHPSTLGYSLAKRIGMLTVQSYKRVFNRNWINIVPTNIYGINDNFNLENSHVIPALINKANAISKSNEDFVIWGDGTSLRQFIFSDDLAQLIKWAESNWHEDEPFMAVNPEEYTITELSFMIAKKFNIPENRIKYDFAKPGGIPRMTASTNAFWYHFTPLERGLDQTINWYKNNYQNIRK